MNSTTKITLGTFIAFMCVIAIEELGGPVFSLFHQSKSIEGRFDPSQYAKGNFVDLRTPEQIEHDLNEEIKNRPDSIRPREILQISPEPTTYRDILKRGNPDKRYEGIGLGKIWEISKDFEIPDGKEQSIPVLRKATLIDITTQTAKIYDGTFSDFSRGFVIKNTVKLLALAATNGALEQRNNGWILVKPTRDLTLADVSVMAGKDQPTSVELKEYSENGFWVYYTPRDKSSGAFKVDIKALISPNAQQ